MNELEFFKKYISAIKKAISNDEKNYGYLVKSFDWYIEDEGVLEKMEVFKNKNYKKFQDIFDMEDNYFDAKSHYAHDVKDKPINEYKKSLLDLVSQYIKKMELEIID